MPGGMSMMGPLTWRQPLPDVVSGSATSHPLANNSTVPPNHVLLLQAETARYCAPPDACKQQLLSSVVLLHSLYYSIRVPAPVLITRIPTSVASLNHCASFSSSHFAFHQSSPIAVMVLLNFPSTVMWPNTVVSSNDADSPVQMHKGELDNRVAAVPHSGIPPAMMSDVCRIWMRRQSLLSTSMEDDEKKEQEEEEEEEEEEEREEAR
ncbi:unnamed protein product [Hydatigera taeniaeformis]|uniref:Uncharacterized protein n=1 Tax=Hydatigena taeniaeformis TaxID=6205 RepID=A0A0R3WNL2_HYDTA|nr:unnamed protein product [Hydatigera taeniaeformis]